MPQVLLERDAFRDVADRQHDAVHALVAEQVGGDGLGPHPLAIGADHPAPDVAGGHAAHQRGGEVCFVGGAVGFVHQICQRAVHHPVAREAEHTLGGWADVADDAHLVEDREHIGRMLHQRSEARLGFLRCLLELQSHVLAHGGELSRHHEHRQQHRTEHEIGDAIRLPQRHDEQEAEADHHRHVRHDAEAGTQRRAAKRWHQPSRVSPAHAGSECDQQVATDAQRVGHLRHGRRIAKVERTPGDVGGSAEHQAHRDPPDAAMQRLAGVLQQQRGGRHQRDEVECRVRAVDRGIDG